MKRLVGKCGDCGGRVFIPTIWHGVNPPHPQCESCGSVAGDTAHLPTLPMRKNQAGVTMVRRVTVTGDFQNLYGDMSMQKCPTLNLRLR